MLGLLDQNADDSILSEPFHPICLCEISPADSRRTATIRVRVCFEPRSSTFPWIVLFSRTYSDASTASAPPSPINALPRPQQQDIPLLFFLFPFFLNCRLSFLIQIRRNFCESKCDKMVNLEEIFDKNLYLFFYYYIIFSSRFFFIVSSFLPFKSRGIFVISLRCAKRSKDCYKVLYRNYFVTVIGELSLSRIFPMGNTFFYEVR